MTNLIFSYLLKEKAINVLQFLVRYHVAPHFMGNVFNIQKAIKNKEIEIRSNYGTRGAQPWPEEDMNELREKMFDEFESNQMKKVSNLEL
jgi:hypothetical protein